MPKKLIIKKKKWTAPIVKLLSVSYTAGGRIYDPTESNGYGGPHGNHSS